MRTPFAAAMFAALATSSAVPMGMPMSDRRTRGGNTKRALREIEQKIDQADLMLRKMKPYRSERVDDGRPGYVRNKPKKGQMKRKDWTLRQP